MNFIERYLHKIDRYQQKHPAIAFSHAVVKKYSEDQGGYQAALLTYYAFLSLFPLLLVFTTIAQWLLGADSHLRTRVINGATTYFPIIGSQLQHNVHGFSKTGLPLLIGLLVLLYGARGVADAFRHMVNHVWRVPITERSGFFPALGRSFSIVFLGGFGLISSAIVASYATSSGRDYGLRALFIAISAIVLLASFLFVIKMALNGPANIRQIWLGATIATVGLLILQSLGGYLITRELKNLNSLYGTFAVVLGLLFWLYLQTQIIVYAIEIDTVRTLKLYPRSFLGK
jgi:membrane protein